MTHDSEELAIRPEPEPRLLEIVDEGLPLGRVKRLDVYAEAYFLRMHDALAEDFVTVRSALGEDRFRRFAAEYLAKHPSKNRNIELAGAQLPAFAAEHRFRSDVPALADLAALDWATLKAFSAPDLPPFDPGPLAALDEKAWLGVRFRIDSSVSALASPWPIDLAWREEKNGAELAKEKTRLVVYRHDEEIFAERLGRLAFDLLLGMREGKTLSELGEMAAARGGKPDDVQKTFADFVSRGIVREVIP